MDNKQIRFDLELNESDFKGLEEMMKNCHRTRKNMCEALVMIAIRTFNKGKKNISLDDLGIVLNTTK